MLKSALVAKLNSERRDSKKKKTTVASASPIKKSKKAKVKTPKAPEPTLAAYNFDEEICDLGTKFRIDPNNVRKGVAGLITFTSENPKLKNQLFDDDKFSIKLQISCVKVPPGHSSIVRIPLKHSVLTPDSEVCLIVPDVKGIKNKNHDEHLLHYEKLLRVKGVKNITKIMTFHEFRTEYETFELKNRLVELYDAFLADGRISGKVVKKCGSTFYKKHKVPTAIKLQVTKLNDHIEQTLKKTPLYLHMKGDCFVAEVGHSKMSTEELVENVFYLIKGLEKFPGGFGNIRSLNLFSHRGISVPIFSTLKNQNEVEVPKHQNDEMKTEEVSGELTTRLNAGVTVSSTGDVVVYKLQGKAKNRI